MPKIFSKSSKKTGLPPGTLIHIGVKHREDVKIAVYDYNSEELFIKENADFSDIEATKEKNTITWINIEGIHDISLIEKIGCLYSIHPLTLEDIVNSNQRPKIDEFDNYIFIVMKMLFFDKNNDEIVAEQISLIIGENYLLTFQEGICGDVFNPIRERLKNSKSKIRKSNIDYLAYSLLDAIVDNYFLILDHIEEKINFIEERFLNKSSPIIIQVIHNLKKEMSYLKRYISPIRDIISYLEKENIFEFSDDVNIYLRDIYDHIMRINESIEMYREMLSNMIDIYLTNVSNKLNIIMKFLTILSTIFIPITFIAGVYGMNFDNMPELHWKYGYFYVLGIMIIIVVSMLIFFKRKNWF